MNELFYYIHKDKSGDDLKKFLNVAVANMWSIWTLYQYISIKRASNHYVEPEDDEICLKIDYVGDYEDDGDSIIKGYSLNYKPVMDTNKEKKEKDDTFTSILILSGIFILGMFFGRKSIPFRQLKARDLRKVHYPDLRYERPDTLTDKDFHDVIDWFVDKETETFMNNDLYICTGPKRRK